MTTNLEEVRRPQLQEDMQSSHMECRCGYCPDCINADLARDMLHPDIQYPEGAHIVMGGCDEDA